MRALRRAPKAETPSTGRADPAPSRLKYRLQRWMLTPGVRSGLRYGLPLVAVLAGLGGYFADQTRRDEVVAQIQAFRDDLEQRPEFMVNVMAIDGADKTVSADIRDVLSLDLPISSFDLDLEVLRDRIVDLDPVKTAAVRIRPGGILQVDVEERTPAVVWRTREGLELLDDSGVHVAELGHRGLHPNLPLVAGAGADGAVPEALRLMRAARPLGTRLRGLVRVGERRWDVVLDRGQRVMLPEDAPVAALERMLAVDQVKDLLERDVAVVDMRLAARMTVRMSDAALTDWWRIKELNSSGFSR